MKNPDQLNTSEIKLEQPLEKVEVVSEREKESQKPLEEFEAEQTVKDQEEQA